MPSYKELTSFPPVTILDRVFYPPEQPKAEAAEPNPDLIDIDGNVYEDYDDVPCACWNCGCPAGPSCCCTCWRH